MSRIPEVPIMLVTRIRENHSAKEAILDVSHLSSTGRSKIIRDCPTCLNNRNNKTTGESKLFFCETLTGLDQNITEAYFSDPPAENREQLLDQFCEHASCTPNRY